MTGRELIVKSYARIFTDMVLLLYKNDTTLHTGTAFHNYSVQARNRLKNILDEGEYIE